MTTFTIVTKGPCRVGQRVGIRCRLAESSYCVVGYELTGLVERVSPHELLVRVGGRALAFQQHEPGSWTWRE